MMEPQNPAAAKQVGRYALYDVIGSGGMATVHLGRMVGQVGFSKTVAIKRLHPHLAMNIDFVKMLVDEARLASRVQHPNVVPTLDVVVENGEVAIVLEYVHGESFWHLLTATKQRGYRVPEHVVSAIIINALHGLHAAHEARDEHGRPLEIVHRDVSPQNILVGVDGVARMLDFGVAKGEGRLQATEAGQLKGKLAYMAPEQIQGQPVTRRADIYAAAAVLWGGLVGRRLVSGENEAEVLGRVIAGDFPPPSTFVPELPPELDAVVMRGLSADPSRRFASARDMAVELERACRPASPFAVAEWVNAVGAEALALRTARVRDMESTSDVRVSLQAIPLGSSGFTPSQSGVVGPYAGNRANPMAGTVVRSLAPPRSSAHALGQPDAPAHEGRGSGALIATAIITMAITFGALGIAYTKLAPPSFGRRSEAASVAPTVTSNVVPAGSLVPPADPPPTSSVAPASTAPSPPEGAPHAMPKAPPTSQPSPAQAGRKHAPSKAAPTAGCDSPFYVDADGIKQIKPECM